MATITLTDRQAQRIQTALLCFACDARSKAVKTGNNTDHEDANYWWEAYQDLKTAMGE